MGVKIQYLVLFLTGFVFLSTLTVVGANDRESEPQYSGPQYKRVGGIQGPPGLKRGVDLGWDKGYLAGKAEVEHSVEPDPTRFEDYNDPNKWYRYEFGKRSQFVRGFRGGFLKGYSYGLQQRVQYRAPLKTANQQFADSTDAAMGLPGVQGPEARPADGEYYRAAKPARVKAAKKSPDVTQAMILSDAL